MVKGTRTTTAPLRKPFADLSPRQKEAFGTPSGFARFVLGLKLYPNQCEILDSFGPIGSQISVRSCNEFGKTTHVIAPLILWHASVYSAGRCISTSGSWTQVTTQLVPALRKHSHNFPGWQFSEDEIKVDGLPRWVGFSTTNPGRAEGFHGTTEAPLLVLADEAKSVGDEIFRALDRCNPQRIGLLSSPGYATGEFYRSQTGKAGTYRTFRVEAKDCPHISPASIQRRIDKYGLNHPLVRSMIFAEFMDMVEGSLLSLAQLERCLEEPPTVRTGDPHVFLDFAAGGDENVIGVCNGNKVWIADCWRETDTMSAVGRFVIGLEKLKREIGLRPDQVEGDADGLGKPMLDAIRQAGWAVNDFHGASPPLADEHYRNRTSEVWFAGAKKIAERQVILPRDEDLNAQLINRQSRCHSSGKLWIESKEEMRKRGVSSPDRADAVLGALGPAPMTRGYNLVEIARGWEQQQEQMEVDSRVLAGFNSGDY